MIEFIVLGDLHQGGVPSIIPDDIRMTAVEVVMRQVTGYARDNGVEHIIQVGDVFHTPHPKPDDYLNVLRGCRDGHWTFMSGNHDYESVSVNALTHMKSMLELFNATNVDIHIRDPAVTTLRHGRRHKLYLIFLPWPHVDHDTLREYSNAIVFAHVPRIGVMSETGHVFNSPEHDFDLHGHRWFIGDIHKRQRGDGYSYPGAALPLRFGDPNKRYFDHVTVRDDGTVHTRAVPIAVPYTLRVKDMTHGDVDVASIDKFKPERDFIKVKLPRDVDMVIRDELASRPNVVISHVGRSHDVDVDAVTIRREREMADLRSGSTSVRRDLLVDFLRSKGLSSKKVKRAMRLAISIEDEVTSKAR